MTPQTTKDDSWQNFLFFAFTISFVGSLISLLFLIHHYVQIPFTLLEKKNAPISALDGGVYTATLLVCGVIFLSLLYLHKDKKMYIKRLVELKQGSDLLTLFFVSVFMVILVQTITIITQLFNNVVNYSSIAHFLVDFLILGGLFLYIRQEIHK